MKNSLRVLRVSGPGLTDPGERCDGIRPTGRQDRSQMALTHAHLRPDAPGFLACIGLGALGLPMAANLQAAGYACTCTPAAVRPSPMHPWLAPPLPALPRQPCRPQSAAVAVRQRRRRSGVGAVG